jgi:hypothetical protein
MDENIKNTNTLITISISVLVIGLLLGNAFPFHMFGYSMDQNMHHARSDFISLREDIHQDLMPHGDYRCCLENPCTYCIEKTPGHGKGATCDCLGDLINGVHPCGECIGEILEGHGNPFLSEYFARAIAEKTGEEEAIKRIISNKYDISIEDQL